MKKFNLKNKLAAIDTITDKQIEKNRNEMDISNDDQKVVEKNINLSIPVKNKDSLIPFNAQLEAVRKKEQNQKILESKMDKKEVSFGEQKDDKTSINAETQKYVDEKEEAYKKAENKIKTEADFWDNLVGVQMEGEGTKVPNNVPDKGTHLPNKKAMEEVKGALKDADAMLFHIFATAKSQGRDLNEDEKQQVIDINAGKSRLIAKMVEPFKRCLNYNSDPIIKKTEDGKFEVIETNGTSLDIFDNIKEAKSNYPEASEENNE